MLLALDIFVILSVVFGIIIICLVLLLLRNNKSCSKQKKEIASVSSKSVQIADFMKFFADNICTNLKGAEVCSRLALKVARLVEAEDICIYSLNEATHFVPIGYTETFPLLFNKKSFVLSKPRFIIDALKQDKIALNDGIFGEITACRKALFIPDATSDPRLSSLSAGNEIKSFMAMPMIINDSIIGAICAVNSSQNRMFSMAQFDLFESVTKIVSVLYQIIQSYVVASKQDRLNQEIEFTRLLQKSLLPKEPPLWKPFEIYAFTRSAKEVSGDFYDFVQIDNNKLLVVLGDACGKGIPACMMMAMTRSFIRANAGRFTTLSDMMLELNANLYRDTPEGRFTTIACCLLDKNEQTLEFIRAGHTELIVFSSRQKTRKIKPHGTALGLLPVDMAGDYDSIGFMFKPYYSVLLFSDGVSEAVNAKSEEFGSNRLSEVFYESCCRKNSPGKTTDKILRTLDEFSGVNEINDDQTIVIIGHESSFI